MSTVSSGSFRINDTFEAFIHGDADARQSLPSRLHAALRAEARGQARELSDDQIDEVVNEVWCLVLGPRGARWNRDRGSAWTFILQLVKDAARTVRASYAPPGVKTRLDAKAERPEANSRAQVTLDAIPARLVPCATAASLEARTEVRLVAGVVDPTGLDAIFRVEVAGESVNDTAQALGVSRFQLRRLVTRTKATIQLLAA